MGTHGPILPKISILREWIIRDDLMALEISSYHHLPDNDVKLLKQKLVSYMSMVALIYLRLCMII